jgi:hypothetical protein
MEGSDERAHGGSHDTRQEVYLLKNGSDVSEQFTDGKRPLESPEASNGQPGEWQKPKRKRKGGKQTKFSVPDKNQGNESALSDPSSASKPRSTVPPGFWQRQLETDSRAIKSRSGNSTTGERGQANSMTRQTPLADTSSSRSMPTSGNQALSHNAPPSPKDIMERTVIINLPRDGRLNLRENFLVAMEKIGVSMDLVEAMGPMAQNNQWHITLTPEAPP